MGGQTITEKVGNISEVGNANPMTAGMWNQLGNLQGNFLTGMSQFGPTQNIASLAGVTPGIQSIVGSLISPYGQNLSDTTRLMAEESMRGVANEYANAGSLNSGAALSALARGSALPISQAATNIAGMQSQLGGSLLGQALGQMGSAYGTQAGLFGNVLGIQGSYAAPEWWQPTYMQSYQPGALDYITGGLGALGGLATGLGTLGLKPFGGGAGIGGSTGTSGGSMLSMRR